MCPRVWGQVTSLYEISGLNERLFEGTADIPRHCTRQKEKTAGSFNMKENNNWIPCGHRYRLFRATRRHQCIMIIDFQDLVAPKRAVCVLMKLSRFTSWRASFLPSSSASSPLASWPLVSWPRAFSLRASLLLASWLLASSLSWRGT